MAGKTRMKIGICNELFQGWPIAQIFEYAARLGYGGVEIAPFTLADSVRDISSGKRKEIRRAAEEQGIEVIGLHWLLVKPEGLYINHPEPEIRRRTQEYLQELIHFCADLGGKVLSHGSPKQRTIQEGWNFEEGWKRARETLEGCLPTAKERGVTYCIEPLTRSNTNFINTVEEAQRLVAEINHPNFQMLVDCRSAEANEGSAAKAVRKALTSGHLCHVHLNDVSGRGPGFGEVAFSPILKEL
ncbi:MAG: sugar phosphate isomerase/epimerase, partial [Deltaproteobacteria bacterium]